MKQESPIKRRKSRQIMVGNVPVGGDAPIAVQTMTNTLTTDIKGTIAQVQAAAEAGARAAKAKSASCCAARSRIHVAMQCGHGGTPPGLLAIVPVQ